MQRHILGLAPLTSPYSMIAADINHDDKISGSDVVEVRKLILGKIDAFENNTSWRFVDKVYEWPEQDNPWYEAMPESYKIPALNQNMDIDFIGMKIGDVNGSIDLSKWKSSILEGRSDKQLFRAENRYVQKGEAFSVTIKATEDMLLYGWQLVFYAPEVTHMVINGAKAKISAEHMYQLEGQMTMAVDIAGGNVIGTNEAIFVIHGVANVGGYLSDLIKVDADKTAEAYVGDDLQIASANIRWADHRDQLGESLLVSQNQPNPWSDQTKLQVYVPQAGQLIALVKDLTGQVIMQKQLDAHAGMNTLTIQREDIDQPGVYLYEVRFGREIQSGKMVVIR